MDISYGRAERQRGKRERSEQDRARRRERRMAAQLAASLLLFFVVFAGRDAMAEPLERAAEVMASTTDFQAAFADLGKSLAEGESLPTAVGDWCVEVFAPAAVTVAYARPWEHAPTYEREAAFLSQWDGGRESFAVHLLGIETEAMAPAEEGPAPAEEGPAPEEEGPAPEEEGPAPEEIVQEPEPAEPEPAAEETDALGVGTTAMPVSGTVTSPFGYRDSPVDGSYKFHYGLDLAAAAGTEIRAFAGGTVDYVGESAVCGKYIQLRHEGDVTSFYCHCSKVLAHTGDTVSPGQTIALVGETGDATGPHLHLQLKKGEEYLDPADYLPQV